MQTFTVDNLKYTVADADAGTVELIGYKEQPTGKLVIPSTVTCDGTEYSVTRIGNEAFGFCYNLTGITIPEGVTHMGFGAFQYCTSLEQVAIPEGVTSIENWTFGYCSALTEMTIPGSVTSIGDNAFYKCVSLNQVTIPESVTMDEEKIHGKNEGCFMQTLNLGCVGTVVLVLVVVIIFLIALVSV